MKNDNKNRFSTTYGVYLQDTARTTEEADYYFECSCSLCNREGCFCNPKYCDVAIAHEAKLNSIEISKPKPNKFKNYSRIYHTRSYKKTERFGKGTIQRILTIASKKTDIEYQKLGIDQASVYVEMGDVRNAYLILKRYGLNEEAEAIKKILRRTGK